LTIETPRLTLCPLSLDELVLLTEDLPAAEARLGLRYAAEPLDGHMKEAMAGQPAKIRAKPGALLWETFWMLALKAEPVIIGSLCFKGPPDAGGAVEIGYGLGDGWRGCGYMAEAVAAAGAWALRQPGVQQVVAETEQGNTPSENVLRRAGFTHTHNTAGCRWWLLEAVFKGEK